MSESTEKFSIISLNVGKAQPFREDGTLSAIAKMPVTEPQWLGPMGFSNDEVADPIHHGGFDKAVHLYPHDHYSWWRERLGDHPLLDTAAAFGENITTLGLTEENTHIGDQFHLGEAIIEISHGRQPCWKLDHRFERKGRNSVMAAIIQSGYCGMYARVIEPGHVRPDDTLILLQKGDDAWSVARLFRLLIGGGHKKEPELLSEAANLPKLAVAWRTRAQKLMK
ncbi:MAG: MOSC domain-containing protein [Pseudomonadota bacterium]